MGVNVLQNQANGALFTALQQATSAIDEAEEAALYHRIAEVLPATTVISIGHRGSLEAYHQRITVDRTMGHSGRLIDRARHLPGVSNPGVHSPMQLMVRR